MGLSYEQIWEKFEKLGNNTDAAKVEGERTRIKKL